MDDGHGQIDLASENITQSETLSSICYIHTLANCINKYFNV